MATTKRDYLNYASAEYFLALRNQQGERAQDLVVHLPRRSELQPANRKPLECAYAVKYAELNHRNEQRPWSIRQTAVYHRCIHRGSTNASTWVMIAASRRTRRSLRRYTESSPDLAALNPFETHLILLDSLLSNWRPYIAHLTKQITDQVKISTASYMMCHADLTDSPTKYWSPRPRRRTLLSYLVSKSARFLRTPKTVSLIIYLSLIALWILSLR